MAQCEKCGKSFIGVALGGHLTRCGVPKDTCPVCNKVFTHVSFSSHLKSHEKDKKCLNCGGIARGRNRFCGQSCAAVYSNAKKEKKVYICLECGVHLIPNGSTPKFCSHVCHKEHIYKNFIGRWLAGEVDGSTGGGMSVSNHIRKWLERTFGRKCSGCGLEVWMGKPIPLITDHINADSTNSTHKNLRLVCPNCDMLSPTWGNRNKGNGRVSRRNRYKADLAK